MHTVHKCSSHPEGMLDRDQRTIFILETKSNETIHLNDTNYCCDDNKPKNFGLSKNYLNLNVNCDYLHNSYFHIKRVTRFFQKLNKYLPAFFCIWILSSPHFQPKTIMAMPLHMSSDNSQHPKSLANLKMFLSNPCGFEATSSGSDLTDNRRKHSTLELENKDVKFYLGKVESSARTGLSDFKTGYLKNFLLTDFNIPHSKMDQEIAGHHEAWKHQFNPNLLPNGKHLEIEFLKDLPDATKILTAEAASRFNVANDGDRQQLIEMLVDCDERLQRLLVVFYQMHQNLDNFKINFRQDDFATDNIRKVYGKAIDIIRNGLCDVRTALFKLYGVSGMDHQRVDIVDVEYILNNPFKTDSIGDWVNVRQLHDQLEYMTQIFGIWVNQIDDSK